MASIKMGAIVTDIKGKLGGHVFQKGNQSRVLKTGGKPRVNKTATVIDKEAMLSELRSSWNALTAAQRLNWGFAAKNFPFKNQFGDTILYGGYQFFLKLNVNRQLVDNSILTATTSVNSVLGFVNIDGAFIDLSATTYRTSGTSSVTPFLNLLSVQVLSNGSHVINPAKFVSFAFSNGFPSANATRYNQLIKVTGPLTTSSIVIIGARNINPSGFATTYSIVRATIT